MVLSSTPSYPSAPRLHGTVLLLDDDDGFRNALAESLRDDGYDVAEYTTAYEVPPLTALGEVRAVVTDYDMPGTNGLIFADRFHAMYPNVPIIMVTSACTKNLEAQAAARNFVSLLRKPIEYGQLYHLLHDAAGAGG
jgi:two-component system C4-dicarboxylate transport response regulator DctD